MTAVERCLLICALAWCGLAQDTTEATRGLWDENLVKRRPPPATPAKTRKPPVYRRTQPPQKTAVTATPATKAPASKTSAVGITIWALRKPQADMERSRLLVVAEDDGSVPYRVDSSTPLGEGQRVRLTIEVPAEGFLYVVDREQYEDGSLSDPYLIFPILTVNEGWNQVSPGRVIEIPPRENRPPYFTIAKNLANIGKVQTAELLYIIVSPKPISSVKPGYTQQKIGLEEFAQWEKRWGITTLPFELEGGAGQLATPEEKTAVGPKGKPLTQDGPLPQVLHYVPAAFDAPVMFKQPLLIAK